MSNHRKPDEVITAQHSATHRCDLLWSVTAWNDGKIRIFTPETGRLMLVLNNAHSMGATAIACTKDCQKIVSGGGEGQVPLSNPHA